MKLKVGIFFGGPSREREISFAGGRTVYDNLNAELFEPVPIFVDAHRRFILLDWKNIYKGSIRDFFPPAESLEDSPYQIYAESLGALPEDRWEALIQKVGEVLAPEELPHRIHLAFLALHGLYGEDGQLQQELADLGIPYTGSGVRACEIGMDKALQKDLMQDKGFPTPEIRVIERPEWTGQQEVGPLWEEAKANIGFPLVIRPARQGSSIGVSIIKEEAGEEGFREAVDQAFFRQRIPLADWHIRSDYEQQDQIRLLTDLRDGLGFPMTLRLNGASSSRTLNTPDELQRTLDELAAEHPSGEVLLESHHDEERVLLEAFIKGKEFSCIVLRLEDGSAAALPPTEILKGGMVFDYRSKYLPGASRKRTPIDLPEAQVQHIREECERLFQALGFQVYARIDGFIQDDGRVYLNDPNTTSGMLPSSFFFHQAAEVGLNPSQFLTYIVRTSLQERLSEAPERAAWRALLEELDEGIDRLKVADRKKKQIGVVLGGYSFERHISVESGRNIYEKLASSEQYQPYPLFLHREAGEMCLSRLPIHLLLKDNADDIREKLGQRQSHPIIERIKDDCASITQKYGSPDLIFYPERWSFEQLKDRVDAVFIALHGRPGEDGELQERLETLHIPYNGSGPASSRITINKYETLRRLREAGFPTARQELLQRTAYQKDPKGSLDRIESAFGYPLIAKPVDDGCSSAVQLVGDRSQLEAYLELIFRDAGTEEAEWRKKLKIPRKAEFPEKETVLLESVIRAAGASHFLEITGGMVTHLDEKGEMRYEVFEPSETLASGAVLSLEEKFLAGEGQNITPARFSPDPDDQQIVSGRVRAQLEQVARQLGVEGYCRIDAFVRVYPEKDPEVVVIELNSLPGMTPATAIFHQAALNGYSPFAFIHQILTFAFDRQRLKATSPPTATDGNPLSMSSSSPQPGREGNPAAPSAARPDSAPPSITDRLRKFGKQVWDRVWEFIASPFFLKNLLGLVLAAFLLLFVTQSLIRLYTHHGQSLQVPNFSGMELDDARSLAGNRNIEIEVSGQSFDLEKPPGVILRQDPQPLSRVKRNRTIYVVVNSDSPNMFRLPTLAEVDNFAQYCSRLRSRNINCAIREEVFSGQYAEGTIMDIFYRGERITNKVDDGFDVPEGSTLEMTITKGVSNTVEVPDLVCLSYPEARFKVRSNGLEIGDLSGTVTALESAFVARQDPAYQAGQNIAKGSPIDLYLISSRPAGCPTNPREDPN